MTTRVNFLYIAAPGRKNKSPPPNRIFEIWIMMCKAFIPNANYNSIGPGSLHPIVLAQKNIECIGLKHGVGKSTGNAAKKAQCRTLSLPLTVRLYTTVVY